MREIKFRAWNNKFKEFKFMSLIKYLGGRGIMDDWADSENSVWEQYTGLKDKNSVEIYEGDILQDVDDSTIVGVVEYDEAFGEYDCGDNNLYECTRDCVVIGNIHENADLLEETK